MAFSAAAAAYSVAWSSPLYPDLGKDSWGRNWNFDYSRWRERHDYSGQMTAAVVVVVVVVAVVACRCVKSAVVRCPSQR